MSDLFKDVSDFQNKFEIPKNEVPGLLPHQDMIFKIGHMQEELNEIVLGHEENNLEDIFDGLIDLIYVALGTAHMMQLPFNKGWERVHIANMMKIRATCATQSKRGSSIDVVKPEGWQSPVLSDLLED